MFGLYAPLRGTPHSSTEASSPTLPLSLRQIWTSFLNNPSSNFNMALSPVILITAGSAGLGAAAAKLFAASGYRVVINYASNESRATELLKELEKISTSTEKGEKFKAIKADLGKREDIVRLVEEVTAATGRLDVVFSNGGWTEIRNFSDLDDNMVEDDWDRCFNMNVKSHLWLMHASKKWLDESEGAFITTASLAGVKPSGSSLVRFLVR